ncbi:MAG: hypothetical protein H8D67_08345 [Deltaproteobacteria bacterium]|nr:hypothetical protein [Deltaproteobacteria bacterium]
MATLAEEIHQTSLAVRALRSPSTDLPRSLPTRLAYLLEHQGTDVPPPYDNKEPFVDMFEENQDKPYAIRLAKSIVASWLQTEPVIRHRELIVGTPRPRRLLQEVYSYGISFDGNRLAELEKSEAGKKVRARYEAVASDFYPKTGAIMQQEGVKRFGSNEQFAATRGIFWPGSFQGHNVPDFGKLLTIGISGIVDEIESWRDKHAEGLLAGGLRRYGTACYGTAIDAEKKSLLEACAIVYRGMSDWICSYSQKAAEMAAETDDAVWQLELKSIADCCAAIAWDAPKTLHQAAQLSWFYMLWDGPDSQGRVDQYLYPFFRGDVESGRLSEEEAFDLIGALFLKFNRYPAHHVALAGQTADGHDASNALTGLCLEVARSLHLTMPRFTIRVCSETPDWVIQKGIKMWSEGMGDPTIFNDEVVVDGLVQQGIPVYDARDYAFGGCTEIQLCGKGNFGGEDADFNLAKCLELTLNDGRCRITGLQLGPKTGNPREFFSFDEVMTAYRTQVEMMTKHCCEMSNIGSQIRSANLSKLVRMPLIADCLERGIDPDAGGALYGHGEVMTLGIGITGDSLAAIKKLVFDEREITMAELIDALDADFEGYEPLRQRLSNEAPKYGNDDLIADKFAAEVAGHFWREVNKYLTNRGDPYFGCVIVLGRNIGFGHQTGATPDGRKSGAPLEASIEPRAGMNRSGPTAMLRSAAKIPQYLAPGGVLCNIKIPATLMKTAEQRRKVADVIRTYFYLGGQQVMNTPVDSETLRKAQENPEEYGDLIVRVGGYSAYFVHLSRELQDDIVARADMVI